MEWPSIEDAKRFIHREVMGYMKAMKLGVEPDELRRAIDELEDERFERLSKAKHVAMDIFPELRPKSIDHVIEEFAIRTAKERGADKQLLVERAHAAFEEEYAKQEVPQGAESKDEMMIASWAVVKALGRALRECAPEASLTGCSK